MQVRYQAALRPENRHYSEKLLSRLALEKRQDLHDFPAQHGKAHFPADIQRRPAAAVASFRAGFFQAVARAVDGETLFVEQIADAANQQHFMMLVVAAVAAPLDGSELGELLLPVAQHVRLHAAQVTHLADGKIAFGRYGRQFSLWQIFQHRYLPPGPSISGWHERSPRAAR